MDIIKSLVSVRNNNSLNIVDASGHTPGFYGFFLKSNIFSPLFKNFFFRVNEAKTTEIQLILISAGAVSFK